ncbi:citrate-binding protein-like [Triticum aestivum]|uniref:citrate-binding protein-like n=1 Tax=Triticum aestivum TaxID=4565 RepID=UPI001ABC9840|nr:citrate-binding protein-like [Triticum aestivum]
MPLLVVLLALLSCATHGANAAACDPTTGFVTVPLTDAQLPVQRPYDVPLDQRYELANGMRRMWVYCTDKPHSPTSHTKPRTEIRTVIQNYSSGVWQFEGYAFVPSGTTGVSIMQVFGAAKHATTLMLHVYGGALVYYNDWTRVVDRGIYNRWFRLNVIHDVGGAGTLTVFIDGQERLRVAGRGGDLHYFKFGVYTQTAPSHLMESRWRDVRLFTKEAY